MRLPPQEHVDSLVDSCMQDPSTGLEEITEREVEDLEEDAGDAAL